MIIDMNTTNKTTVMAICQIFAQKQSGHLVPLNQKNGSRSVYEDMTANAEADKSRKKTTHTSIQREKSRFDDALRKKMDAEAPPKPDNSKPLKKKDLDDIKGVDGMSDTPVPQNQTQSQTLKQEHTLQRNNMSVNSTANVSVSDVTDRTVSDHESDSAVAADKVAQNLNASIKIGSQAESGAETKMAGPVAESGQTQVNQNAQQQPATPGSKEANPIADGNIGKNNVPSSERTEKPAGNRYILQEVQEQASVKIAHENSNSPFIARQGTPIGKEDSHNPAQTLEPSQNTQGTENAAKEQAFVHRINVSMQQIESIKAEKQHQLTEKTAIKAESELDKLIPADNSTPQTAPDKVPVSGRPAEMIIHEGSKLNVGQQIQESVRTSYNSGTQQIIIRLDPPDLGRVTIRFTEQKDGITGTLHVDKADTKYEIQQALPSILQNLQNADIQIRKMDVVLNNPQQETSTGEFTNPNDGFQEQNASSHQGDSAGMSFEQDSSQANGYSSPDAIMELSDKSINMLI